MRNPLAVVLAAGLMGGCGVNLVKLACLPPDRYIDGICYVHSVPSPTPTATPTATPEPSPVVPTPTPSASPSPAACPLPVFGTSLGLIPPTRVAAVDVALDAVRREHPEFFKDGGTRIADWPTTGSGGEALARQFFLWMQEALARQGICSWIFDELQVQGEGGRHSEGYRLVNFGGGGVFSAANAYKFGSMAISPVAEPTPTPAPTPSPNPPNTVVGYYRNIVKPNGGQKIDLSVVACEGTVKPCGGLAKCCEWSAEKGGEDLAKALFGTPEWETSGSVILVPADDAGNQKKVIGGEGLVRVCGSRAVEAKAVGACVNVNVRAADPACTLVPGSNQGCVVR